MENLYGTSLLLLDDHVQLLMQKANRMYTSIIFFKKKHKSNML